VQQQRSAQPRVRIRMARSGADMTMVRSAVDTSTRDQDMNKSQQQQQLVTGPVVVYNVFCLLPVDMHLAADYVYVSFICVCS